MKRASANPVVPMVIALMLWSSVVVAVPVEPAPMVWVGDNGSVYHRAGCPRLRFERSLALADAAKLYAPCPVCHPDSPPTPGAPAPERASLPAAIPPVTVAKAIPASATAPPAEVVAPAAGHETHRAVDPTRRSQSGGQGRHAVLGAVLGGVVGLVGGLFLASHVAFSDGEGSGFVVWGAATVACTVGGYALGGGFSEHVDEAIERDRARLREQLAADASRPRAVTAVAEK